jgi:hypothetical protein
MRTQSARAAALSPASDLASMTRSATRQVGRDASLGQADLLHAFGHGVLGGQEELQQAQPGRVTQRVEEPGYQLHPVGGPGQQRSGTGIRAWHGCLLVSRRARDPIDDRRGAGPARPYEQPEVSVAIGILAAADVVSVGRDAPARSAVIKTAGEPERELASRQILVAAGRDGRITSADPADGTPIEVTVRDGAPCSPGRPDTMMRRKAAAPGLGL